MDFPCSQVKLTFSSIHHHLKKSKTIGNDEFVRIQLTEQNTIDKNKSLRQVFRNEV